MGSIFSSFNINSSGLTAQRYRMDIILQNTTRTADGTPYRRKVVTFAEKNTHTPFSRVLNTARDRYSGDGVKVDRVYEDEETDMTMVYDPSHPDADENGYVTYPHVNIITEMTSRAYEANSTAFNASKAIAMKGLEIGQSQ